ncbi:MAG: sulfatase-like hydrolase/transferase, partial [Candidatus Sumerlaeota bacterium]|nr:sulfatase-like hydrolase/transferase [Candidatus Sumerlaeota bacterium]
PHEPWDPPREYADRYTPGYTGLDFIWPGVAWEKGEPTPEEIERIRALYFGEVTFIDKWIARLMDKIDQLRLWDDTVVVFTSDHGTQMLDNGKIGKHANDLRAYNTRIRFDIRHPNGPRGKKVRGFVQAHDLLPTLFGMLDFPIEVDGRDVWPMAERDGAPPARDHVVIGWSDWTNGRARGHASVRDDEWNYQVATGVEDPAPKLYHLSEDPLEKTNVIDRFPEAAARQRRRLEAVLKQPLPGVHDEVGSHVPYESPMDICCRHWFKGAGGPPRPE